MADIETSILIRILDAFTAPLKNLDTGLKDVEGTAKAIEKRFKLAADLNQAAEGAGRFGRMLLGPIQDSVMEYARFEKAMSRVAALSGQAKGSPLFEQMKAQAEELGAATEYSAEEVAQLMTEYSQAGFKPGEILGMTAQTLSAASAAGIGLADTARIVGGTMNSMGLSVGEASRVVDVLTKSTAESNANITDLGEAMAYVGPVARNANMSLEMTGAMIGKLSDNMITGSAAGTGLRATIAKLVDPSREATTAFAKMGIGADALKDLQANVAAGKLDVALQKIGEATKKLPDAQRMKVLSQIFGLDASAAANVLIKASMDVSDKGLGALMKSLHQLDDDTNKMAKTMTENLMGDFERAEGAISGLKTAVGEALAPSASAAAKTVESWAGQLADYAKEQPTITRATGELAATLGGLAIAMQGGLLAASAYQSAMGGLTKAYAGMSQSLAGQLGLVALAGTAGYVVGKWANETFELDSKIAELLGRGKAQTNKGEKASEAEIVDYAGGWQINQRTGEVVTMGTGEGPAQVRRARAKGATTKAELSGLIGQEVSAVTNRPLAERAAEAETAHLAQFGPYAPGMAPGKPTPLLPRSAGESASALATKEQTAALLQALRAQEAQQKRIADGMERLRYLSPGGGSYGVVR